ncbi:MAG: gluconate 2-dehydrogenase subunit 3 family protein [Balneolaceae bacterium]
MDRKEAIKRTALVMGGAIFAPNILGILKGCTATPGVDWKPVFFSNAQARLVSELAETILPEDEHPGARELGVPAFIESMVAEIYDKDNRDRFVQGIESFNNSARQMYNSDFADCTPEQKFELADRFNREALTEEHSNRPFFLAMKELTILGYFTSETGATKVIKHNPVPGVYEGCIPYEEVGKVWAE